MLKRQPPQTSMIGPLLTPTPTNLLVAPPPPALPPNKVSSSSSSTTPKAKKAAAAAAAAQAAAAAAAAQAASTTTTTTTPATPIGGATTTTTPSHATLTTPDHLKVQKPKNLEHARELGMEIVKPLRDDANFEFCLRTTTHPNSELSTIAKFQLVIDHAWMSGQIEKLKVTYLRAHPGQRLTSALANMRFDCKRLAEHYRINERTVKKIVERSNKSPDFAQTKRPGRKGKLSISSSPPTPNGDQSS